MVPSPPIADPPADEQSNEDDERLSISRRQALVGAGALGVAGVVGGDALSPSSDAPSEASETPGWNSLYTDYESETVPGTEVELSHAHTSMLHYLGASWNSDLHEDRLGEGKWQHTFVLNTSAFGIKHREGESTSYAPGFHPGTGAREIDADVESTEFFGADETLRRAAVSTRTKFSIHPPDGAGEVGVGVRRDPDLFQFTDPAYTTLVDLGPRPVPMVAAPGGSDYQMERGRNQALERPIRRTAAPDDLREQANPAFAKMLSEKGDDAVEYGPKANVFSNSVKIGTNYLLGRMGIPVTVEPPGDLQPEDLVDEPWQTAREVELSPDLPAFSYIKDAKSLIDNFNDLEEIPDIELEGSINGGFWSEYPEIDKEGESVATDVFPPVAGHYVVFDVYVPPAADDATETVEVSTATPYAFYDDAPDGSTMGDGDPRSTGTSWTVDIPRLKAPSEERAWAPATPGGEWNQKPIAAVHVEDTSLPDANGSVETTFDASASLIGSREIQVYDWRLFEYSGDPTSPRGPELEPPEGGWPASGETLSYVFGADGSHGAGDYLAAVTVDDGVQTDTTLQRFQISSTEYLDPRLELTTEYGDDRYLTVGETATVSVAGDDRDAIEAYAWSLPGDGNDDEDFVVGAPSSREFAVESPGWYTVELRVSAAASTDPTVHQTVRRTVYAGDGSSIIRDVTASPQSPDPGQSVTFEATTTDDAGPVSEFAWTFTDPDGTEVGSATGRQVTESFADPGIYGVELVVTTESGRTATASMDLEVATEPIEPAIDVSPADPEEGDTVTLDASGSAAPDDDPITDYEWTVAPDPDDADAPDTVSRSGETAAYTVPDADYDYVLELTVTTESGRTATTDRRIAVSEPPTQPPEPAMTITPERPHEGETVTLDGSGSSAPEEDPIAEYTWTIEPEPDDTGAPDVATRSGETAEYAVPDDGYDYVVELAVTTEGGRSAATERTIDEVRPPEGPIEPSIAISPERPHEGETVTLDGGGSSSPDGDPIAAYDWTIAPDPDDADAPDTVTPSGETVGYTVPDADYDYVLELAVTTEGGRSATTERTIADVEPPNSGEVSVVSSSLEVGVASFIGHEHRGTVTFENTGGNDQTVTVSLHRRDSPFFGDWQELRSTQVTVPAHGETTANVETKANYQRSEIQLRATGNSLRTKTYRPPGDGSDPSPGPGPLPGPRNRDGGSE